MKAPILIICFLLVGTYSFAGIHPKEKLKQESRDFRHYAFEFHFTPFVTYYFYQHAKPGYEDIQQPYKYSHPMAGFDIGGCYTYRPVHVFGLSAGLNLALWSAYRRQVSNFDFDIVAYTDKRSTGLEIYLTLPVQFHFYKQMKGSTFEFSTGPDFNFEIFGHGKVSRYNEQGQKTSSFVLNTSLKFAPILGWTVLLGAEIVLTQKANLFIGPQVNFFQIASFYPIENENNIKYGHEYPIALGLKLGFRFTGKK